MSMKCEELNEKEAIFDTSIDNYISDEYSICREERQYALFLYNVFLKCKYCESWLQDKGTQFILERCGIKNPSRIVDVFYEATFMRDTFERLRKIDYYNKDENTCLKEGIKDNRKTSNIKGKEDYSKKFNQELIEFINDNSEAFEGLKNEIEKQYPKYKENRDRVRAVNLGHNSIFESGDECVSVFKFIAKCMMNAKPDIVVRYITQDSKEELKFIECKFESKEDRYIYKEKGKNSCSISQTNVQNAIAKFYLEKYFGCPLEKKLEKENRTNIVIFSRKESTEKIFINRLIKINKRIMQCSEPNCEKDEDTIS